MCIWGHNWIWNTTQYATIWCKFWFLIIRYLITLDLLCYCVMLIHKATIQDLMMPLTLLWYDTRYMIYDTIYDMIYDIKWCTIYDLICSSIYVYTRYGIWYEIQYNIRYTILYMIRCDIQYDMVYDMIYDTIWYTIGYTIRCMIQYDIRYDMMRFDSCDNHNTVECSTRWLHFIKQWLNALIFAMIWSNTIYFLFIRPRWYLIAPTLVRYFLD